MVHNRYRQRGGEDTVYDAEVTLLRAHGHTVLEFSRDNNELAERPSLAVALSSVWSRRSRKALGVLISRAGPDVVHCHNTHPMITPSAYYAAGAQHIPVVQTLHNFRLICPNALLFRKGTVCEDCVGRAVPWPGVLHGCYRGSRAASAVVAATLTVHYGLDTWRRRIDRFIALTEFAKAKFIEGGLPSDRIIVKPNFALDCAPRGEFVGDRHGALFVGRLSLEKGISLLIRAWRELQVPLTLVGDGPLLEMVRENQNPMIRVCGRQSSEEVMALMRNASFLILPSECYEGFAVVIAEAFCQGVPVIASNLGAMAETIADGVCGLLFTPGDAADLAAKVRWAANNSAAMAEMGLRARRRYEELYSPRANYDKLIGIYESVVQEKSLASRELPAYGASRG